MLNFKSFQSAKCVLAGIELMNMIRKGHPMMMFVDCEFTDMETPELLSIAVLPLKARIPFKNAHMEMREFGSMFTNS